MKTTADPSLERDTRDLYQALTDLVRMYQFRDRNCICCHDISVTQCYALDALVREGTMTLGSLASTLMLDKSTTSRVVDALDRKDYVKRVRHPDDARVVRLTATIRGRNLQATIQRELLAEERAIIEGLPEEVRRATVGVVRELAKMAAKRIGREESCCATSACDPEARTEWFVRPARASDLPAVHALLASCGLPLDGVDEQFGASYAVAEHDGDLIGVAGVERHGCHGLLRSVGVKEPWRSAGIGSALVLDRVRWAKKASLQAVYLLTNDAADYFHRHGFSAVARDAAPPEIQASREFSQTCPSSAQLMRLATKGGVA